MYHEPIEQLEVHYEDFDKNIEELRQEMSTTSVELRARRAEAETLSDDYKKVCVFLGLGMRNDCIGDAKHWNSQ